MEEQKTSKNVASFIRLIGILSLATGLFYLFQSQSTEINITNRTIDADTLLLLPKEIAEKTNNTILGGFLIIIGIQLTLVSYKLISEITEQFKNPI